MTAFPKSHILTEAEIRRAEEESGVEYADGILVEKSVSLKSSKTESRIAFLLMLEAEHTRTATVFPSSLGYQCYRDDPRKFRKPDVSVVRSERLAGFDPDTGLLPIPADLVVEVLSPNDLAYEVSRKVREYLDNGFPLVWVVDPSTQTVMIHRADGSGTILNASDEITGENALPSFKAKVGDFFDTTP